MRKTIKYTLLTTLFIFVMMIKVSAADLKITCKYNAGVYGFDYNTNITYKLYSDGSLESSFKKNDILIKDLNFQWQQDSGFDQDFAKSATEGGGYKCPAIHTKYTDGFILVGIGDMADMYYKTATKTYEKVESSTDVVEVTQQCNYKVFKDSDSNIDFKINSLKLEMDSNGNKYIYIDNHRGDIDKAPISYVINNQGNTATFAVDDGNIPKLFIQNPSMFQHNTFNCPYYVYINETSFTDRIYSISTSDKGYDHHMKLYNEKDYDPNKKDDNSIIDPNTGKSISCDELRNIGILDLANTVFGIIVFAGVVLLIVFGIIDFSKATLAEDQDALKKAGVNFGKRVIATVLLILIPLIINILLGVASKTGALKDIGSPEDCIVENK